MFYSPAMAMAMASYIRMAGGGVCVWGGTVNPSLQNTILLKKYHCLLMHFYMLSGPTFLLHVIRILRPLIQRSNIMIEFL